MADKKEIQFDAKNEQIVIGLMLVDAEIRNTLVRNLRQEDFIGDRHKSIFSGLVAITSQGLSFTEPTLIQTSPSDVGGIPYLYKLKSLVTERVTSLKNNIDFHLRILRLEKVKYQLLVKDLPAFHELLEDEDCNPEKLRRELRKLGGLSESVLTNSYVERDTSISEAYKADQKVVVGTRTIGYSILDRGTSPIDNKRLTLGSAPGCVGVLAARPATGKSTFATNLARNIAKAGYKVVIGAFEMNKIPTTHLLIPQWIDEQRRKGADYPKVTITDLISRRYANSSILDEALNGLFSDGNLAIMRNPIYLAESRNSYSKRMIPSEINDRNLDLIENQVSNDSADVWIFDLWERLMFSKKQDDIAVALERMQAMAHYYQKFFLIVQQIGRDYAKSVGKGDNKFVRPPTMNDIKNSGAYEEVADWIMLLHRPALYKRVPDDLLEVYCAKQRLGTWPWAVAFDFDGSIASITNGHRIDVRQYEEETKTDADGGNIY